MKKTIIYKKDRKKFVKLCTQLNELMEHIAEYNSKAYLFVAGESETTFNLYADSTDLMNCDNNMFKRAEKIIESVTVSHCDCGGF